MRFQKVCFLLWLELWTKSMSKISGSTDFEYELATRQGNVRRIQTLIKHRIRPPNALMVSAVMRNHPELLPLLHEAGADPNDADGHGVTALGYAVAECLPDVLETVLRVGADPRKESAGFIPLIHASLMGRKAHVALLLRYDADPNQEGRAGLTALLEAVRYGYADIVEILLDAGGNPYHAGPNNMDSFALAKHEKWPHILKLLKERAGQFPKKESQEIAGVESMIDAIRRRNRREFERCLSRGIDPNEKDKSGWTALERAVDIGDLPFVQKLLKAGADPNGTKSSMGTPLEYAVRGGKAQIVKALLHKGAKVDGLSLGSAPILTATEEGNTGIVQLLLDSGANVNATTRGGQSVLMFAITRATRLVQTLLSHGVDIAACDAQGWTALFHAVLKSTFSVTIRKIPAGATISAAEPVINCTDSVLTENIKLLLKHGADVNWQDNEGRTALTYATSPQVAKLLMDAGARLDIRDRNKHDVSYWLNKSGLFDGFVLPPRLVSTGGLTKKSTTDRKRIGRRRRRPSQDAGSGPR